MTDREEKLNKVRAKQAALTIVTDGEPFIEALQSKIDELKKALEVDVEVNVDDLINELKKIESISPTIKSLVEAIDAIEIPPIPEIPGSIEVKGLTYIVETLDKQIGYLKQIADFKLPDIDIKVETISEKNTRAINKKLDEIVAASNIDISNLLDKASIVEITKRLDAVVEVVGKNVVSQNAEDYMPIRRVVKAGNRLLFDDSIAGGGGGGGGISRDLMRLNDTTIAIVNPDSTYGSADSNNNQKVTLGTELSRTLDSVDTNWYGTPTVATASIATTSTSLLAANANRKGFILTNTDATNPCFVRMDGSAATVTTGYYLGPKANLVINNGYIPTAQLFGIATGGTVSVAVQELV